MSVATPRKYRPQYRATPLSCHLRNEKRRIRTTVNIQTLSNVWLLILSKLYVDDIISEQVPQPKEFTTMSQPVLDDPPSIATHVHGCLETFQMVGESLSKAELQIKRKLQPGAINDALGRFRLWVGNIGAHRRGRSSLDYRLREASHIKYRVIELLQNLQSVLHETLEIISGSRIPWEDLSESDSDASDDESLAGEATTELEQLVSSMAEINTCLMRLSMAIRNPAPHDQFKESAQIDISHFEAFDFEHVRGKFPRAEKYLQLRLGSAISRRRQYLRYREEHHRKLEQGLKTEPKSQENELDQTALRSVSTPTERFESTVASSLPLAVKASTSARELEDDDYYEDTISQTSYASSKNHNSSKLRPPPLPEVGHDGNPFECQLCFRLISVRQLRQVFLAVRLFNMKS